MVPYSRPIKNKKVLICILWTTNDNNGKGCGGERSDKFALSAINIKIWRRFSSIPSLFDLLSLLQLSLSKGRQWFVVQIVFWCVKVCIQWIYRGRTPIRENNVGKTRLWCFSPDLYLSISNCRVNIRKTSPQHQQKETTTLVWKSVSDVGFPPDEHEKTMIVDVRNMTVGVTARC